MGRLPLCWSLLAALALLLAGCAAGVPFAATPLPPLPPLPPRNAAEVAGLDWSAGSGVLVLRQRVLFELRGGRFPLNGLLRLDRDTGSARLAGLDDFGVKLFDLTVTADGYQEHAMLPDLAKRPGLAAAVAASVRRIWLAPRAAADDALSVEPDRYRLTRTTDDQQTVFSFGGAPPQLLEKHSRGPQGAWRVRYYEYQIVDGQAWPRGIVLDDDAAGYRLTVWIDSVRRGK